MEESYSVTGCMRLVSRNQAAYESIADTRDEPIKSSQDEKSANGASSQKQKQPVIVNEIVPITPAPGVPLYQGAGGVNQGSRSGFFLKYDMKEEIGVGSTSKCFRCVRKSDGKMFACKVIDKKQVEIKFSGLLDQFFIEIKVLKTLNHPNIIHLEDTYETSDRIYMVMEMMLGGELFDYVVEKGTLNEEEASLIVRKITSAVAHMHSMDIIHRDLKPENLLLTTKGPNAEVKIIDFGLAKELHDTPAKSFLGTRGYLAPEMLQRNSYDKAVDIWALGVIVFVLLCGCLPFDDDSSRIANETAARKKFTLRFPRWASTLSVSAKDLLHNLLDVNPKTRFTADQALNHPWVSGRTVQPNNYLQSPSMIGERRKELRSPLTPHIVQEQVQDVATGRTGQRMRPTLDAIKEESQQQQGNKGRNPVNGTTRNVVRKNSI